MTPHRLLPIWRDAAGQDTGPIAFLCNTKEALDTELAHWMRSHGRRPGFRMMLIDDLTFKPVAMYRPRRVPA